MELSITFIIEQYVFLKLFSNNYLQPPVQSLRSTFLNNYDYENGIGTTSDIFPQQSRTWSELRRRIALIENPHSTYDLVRLLLLQ